MFVCRIKYLIGINFGLFISFDAKAYANRCCHDKGWPFFVLIMHAKFICADDFWKKFWILYTWVLSTMWIFINYARQTTFNCYSRKFLSEILLELSLHFQEVLRCISTRVSEEASILIWQNKSLRSPSRIHLMHKWVTYVLAAHFLKVHQNESGRIK